MSLLSGLWTGAKMILGLGSTEKTGNDNVMRIASGVGNFIDEQKFTPEEKAVYNANMIGNMNTFMQNTVNENSQRSKTRREISILVIRWALAMLTLSGVLYRIDEGLAIWIRNLVIEDPIGYLVLGIGAFFFGAHIIRAMQKEGK